MPATSIDQILTLTAEIDAACKAPVPVAPVSAPLSVDEIVALQPATPIVPAVPAERPCTRCGGAGEKEYEARDGSIRKGKCFRCEGDGKEPDKATAQARWEKGQERKRKATEAKVKRDAANEQQCETPASLDAIVALSAKPVAEVEVKTEYVGPGRVSSVKPAAISEIAVEPANTPTVSEPTTNPTEIAAKLRIADAVLSCGSPEGLPPKVREALLAFYMGRAS